MNNAFNTDDLRYPIGTLDQQRFTGNEPFDEQLKKAALQEIKFLPSLVENAVLNLDAAQLQVPYRDGGWTIQQVVHHIPDSHMNAYLRIKTGLTEDTPVIKPYDEKEWARLPDTEAVPINISITLLHALHARLYALLNALSREQWERTIFHPALNRRLTIWQLLALYSWHGKHHLAHITSLRERSGWN